MDLNEWIRSLFESRKNIIEEKVQDQTPGSMLIWILFLNKHDMKLKDQIIPL
jgi:hypothetical protein